MKLFITYICSYCIFATHNKMKMLQNIILFSNNKETVVIKNIYMSCNVSGCIYHGLLHN